VARLLGRIKATEATIQLMDLKNDTGQLIIRENGKAVNTTVATEASKALDAIHGGRKE